MIKRSAIVTLLFTIIIVLSSCTTYSQRHYDPPPKAQSLIINTPEPCDIGTLTIKHQGETLYEYTGKISIINDGSNGEQINILIEYPDESVPGLKGE